MTFLHCSYALGVTGHIINDLRETQLWQSEHHEREQSQPLLERKRGNPDFAYQQIIVRDGKGAQDRVTMLPQSLQKPLQHHLAKVQLLHEEDLQEGYGDVYLPYAFVKLSSEPPRHPSAASMRRQPALRLAAKRRAARHSLDMSLRIGAAETSGTLGGRC